MKTHILALAVITITTISCKSSYQVDDFDAVTKDHVSIAVLPVNVQYQGKYVPESKSEDLEKAKQTDSKAFQQGMSDEILRSARTKRRTIDVRLIPSSTVLSKLNEAGIDPIKSWEMDVQKLAKLIGADAVVKGKIIKNQFFSDAASAGAEIGQIVLREVTGGSILGSAANSIQRNKRVVANFELVNAQDGTILWANGCEASFDWKSQHNDVVRYVSRRVARRFPYRR